MADGDLCTVGDVRAYISPPPPAGEATDALLGALITRTSALLKDALGDPLLEADYEDRYDGHGQTVIVLRRKPVTYVHRVTMDGQDVPRSTSATDAGFVLDGRRTLRLRGGLCFRGEVVVRCTAGYPEGQVPAEYVDAVVDTVALVFKRRTKGDIQSESLAGQTVSYINTAVRARVRELIGRNAERIPA